MLFIYVFILPPLFVIPSVHVFSGVCGRSYNGSCGAARCGGYRKSKYVFPKHLVDAAGRYSTRPGPSMTLAPQQRTA